MIKYLVLALLSLIAYFVNGEVFAYRLNEGALCVLTMLVFGLLVYFDKAVKATKMHAVVGMLCLVDALGLRFVAQQEKAMLAILPVGVGLLTAYAASCRRNPSQVVEVKAVVETAPTAVTPVASTTLPEKQFTIQDFMDMFVKGVTPALHTIVEKQVHEVIVPNIRQELQGFCKTLISAIDDLKRKTIIEYTDLKSPEEVEQIIATQAAEFETLQAKTITELEVAHQRDIEKINDKAFADIQNFNLKIKNLEESKKALEAIVDKTESEKKQLAETAEQLAHYKEHMDAQIQEIKAKKEKELASLKDKNKQDIEDIKALTQREVDQLRQELEARDAEIKRLMEKQDQEINDLIKMHTTSQAIFLSNEDIRKQLEDAIDSCTSELDILSPWVAKNVLTKDCNRLLDKMSRAMEKRKCTIKIGYGYTDNVDGDIGHLTREGIAFLEKELSRHKSANRLRLKQGNLHSKLLLCDNNFMIIGSFNFLSFKGDYTQATRDEIAMLYYNPALVKELREQYFNF